MGCMEWNTLPLVFLYTLATIHVLSRFVLTVVTIMNMQYCSNQEKVITTVTVASV